MPPHGTIVGTRTIVDHGPPARRFDIVILAEGFRRRELRAFDASAKVLATRLLALPPFSDLAHLINVHTVRTASTDSGVSDFPASGVPKKSYYNVRGSFPAVGIAATPPSFLGTDTPELIQDAASRVAPLETIELFIVLVNARDFAGCAFPEQRTIFTSRHATSDELVEVVAHECGHAIAQTAEEYIDGTPPPPGKTYRNQVTEADRLAGRVWWKSLAKKRELKLPKRAFRAVHLFGDPDVDFTTPTPLFTTMASRNGMLGLYWGCQDIDPDLPGAASAFRDARGRFYYRAMADCRMRRLESASFCRVCAHLIAERIRAAAV
jgi:hypothetical protein